MHYHDFQKTMNSIISFVPIKLLKKKFFPSENWLENKLNL